LEDLRIIESLLTGAGSVSPILLILWLYLHDLKKDFKEFKKKVEDDHEDCVKAHTKVEAHGRRLSVLEQA